jgi:cyclophilin family peptidyl-prolyl cis-trans isomerase
LPNPGEERYVIVTGMGNITIGLFENATPRTSAFFEVLVENGTYTDVPVDIVVPGGWCFGTGAPQGPWTDVPNEGAAMVLPHDRWAVSMVTHGPGVTGPELVLVAGEWGYHEADGANAVFGVVVEGKDVVEDICELPVDGENRPVDQVLIEEIVIWKSPSEGRPDDGDNVPEENDWMYIVLISVIVLLILLLVWLSRRS